MWLKCPMCGQWDPHRSWLAAKCQTAHWSWGPPRRSHLPPSYKWSSSTVIHTHIHTCKRFLSSILSQTLSLFCWIMSKETYKVCFCCRRKFRLRASEAPPEIKSIFERYSENGFMSASQLRSFLVEVQREEKASEHDAQAIIDGLKHLNIFHHRKGLSLDAFFKFLFSDHNQPLARCQPSRCLHRTTEASAVSIRSTASSQPNSNSRKRERSLSKSSKIGIILGSRLDEP